MKRARRPSTAAAAAATAAAQPFPVGTLRPLFTIHDMSKLYRVSVATIRRGLQAGTWRPLPWDKYPYRWNPDDVEADLSTRRDLRIRNHGRFGDHRLRPAKVHHPNGKRTGKKAAGGSSRH